MRIHVYSVCETIIDAPITHWLAEYTSAMTTATQLVSLSEYLSTSYHPDCDYIDGELRERNMGKWQHARIQYLVGAWFAQHESLWNAIGTTELRIRVSPTRIRIADLAIVRPGPHPDVLTDPPLLVIEVLSPDDTYSELQERSRDYQTMGVETIWIIDPKTRTGRMCLGSQWIAADRLEIPGTPIHVYLPTLFAQMESIV